MEISKSKEKAKEVQDSFFNSSANNLDYVLLIFINSVWHFLLKKLKWKSKISSVVLFSCESYEQHLFCIKNYLKLILNKQLIFFIVYILSLQCGTIIYALCSYMCYYKKYFSLIAFFIMILFSLVLFCSYLLPKLLFLLQSDILNNHCSPCIYICNLLLMF